MDYQYRIILKTQEKVDTYIKVGVKLWVGIAVTTCALGILAVILASGQPSDFKVNCDEESLSDGQTVEQCLLESSADFSGHINEATN